MSCFLRARAPAPVRAPPCPSALRADVGQPCLANAALPAAWQSSAALPLCQSSPASDPRTPCLRRPRTPPALLAPPPCPRLAARLLACKRPLPSWLVGTPLMPPSLGGAVVVSDGSARQQWKRSVRRDTYPQAHRRLAMRTQHQQRPPSIVRYPACWRRTSWWSLLGAGSPLACSPSFSRTTLLPIRVLR